MLFVFEVITYGMYIYIIIQNNCLWIIFANTANWNKKEIGIIEKSSLATCVIYVG